MIQTSTTFVQRLQTLTKNDMKTATPRAKYKASIGKYACYSPSMLKAFFGLIQMIVNDKMK